MTRSKKFNDAHHGQEGTSPEDHIPKFFGKHGIPRADPKKVKKKGAGRGNWGTVEDDVEDDAEFNMTKARRRSNSTTHTRPSMDFKTKFEELETEMEDDETYEGDSLDAGLADRDSRVLATAGGAAKHDSPTTDKASSIDSSVDMNDVHKQ